MQLCFACLTEFPGMGLRLTSHGKNADFFHLSRCSVMPEKTLVTVSLIKGQSVNCKFHPQWGKSREVVRSPQPCCIEERSFVTVTLLRLFLSAFIVSGGPGGRSAWQPTRSSSTGGPSGTVLNTASHSRDSQSPQVDSENGRGQLCFIHCVFDCECILVPFPSLFFF